MVDKPLYKTQLSLSLSLYLSLCLSVSLSLLKRVLCELSEAKTKNKKEKKIYFLIGLSEFFVVGLNPRVGIS